ncbi:MAG: GvpL/GvpF family gas vesicle protein [Streptosporangiales bacterium]|nr:GvpL/GvpF family gas vesicle protein [Streptosporangiales bacterium]MBO0889696.1 GvpL/GvpF family gas vesicle protein [Acidothermales bacterium]
MAEPGRYVYAVCRAGDRAEVTDALTGVRGVADAPVGVLDHATLCAVVSEVDLAEYGEDGLRRNLEDLGWVERVARAHDHVVGAVSTVTTCAPLRLVTICSDDDSVRAKVDAQRDELERTLTLLDGRVEHGVKAYAAEPGATAAAGVADEPTGTAYLMRRRQETATREAADQAAADAADEVHTQLRELAIASRRYPPQDKRLSGRRERMVLNGAYLVDRSATPELEQAVAVLAERHPQLELELTGPWPPYSFAGGEPS